MLISTTHTDADGHYSFEVEAYSYTVLIALSNFTGEGGGTLGGYTPTTPEQCTEQIIDDNVLTCDFGYSRPGAVGDRVWYDANGNGVQDAGEPGINGVVVAARRRRTTSSRPTTTHGRRHLLVHQPAAGTYTVRVDATYLPGGRPPPTTSTAWLRPMRRPSPSSAARTAPTSTSATAAPLRSATGSGTTPTATASRTLARPASTA